MMNTQEIKKAKRRKNKVATGKYPATIPQTNEVAEVTTEENGDAERIAELMDARDDEASALPSFNKGPNPFLDSQKCLLCSAPRTEATSSNEQSATEDPETHHSDGKSFEQLPLWVCQSCDQHTTKGEMNRKLHLSTVAEIPLPAGFSTGQEVMMAQHPINPPLADLSMFPGAGEAVLANNNCCSCQACQERRQISAQHEQETKDLQTVWTSLRTQIRRLYSMEQQALSPEQAHAFREQVDRLCSRDPHQLFQRLESQVREFVIEKKVNLRKKINEGYDTPPQARDIMSMLLNEYDNLSQVARLVSENLSDLRGHLENFNLTWELHNKHLYHSIVYTEQDTNKCLNAICEQLRIGALDKESYTEDTYSVLMKQFVSFRNEMSVIEVLWHECQSFIDRYNDEQNALKVKQKWLKEDWEFFKAQRKILEQQVLKNNPHATIPHSMEAQFTETMRNMLTGQKPPAEESHCPRCSRKRCPCDECTITHMITCGIISPEQLESNGATHTFNFPHDPNRYIIDVTPPSMSSTSSSGSSSPLPVSGDPGDQRLSACNMDPRNVEETDESSSRMDEGADNEEEEEDEDDDDKEEEDNADDEDEDDEEDEDGEEEDEEDADEEEEEEDDDERISEDQKDFDAMLASGKLGLPTAPVVVPGGSLKLWGAVCQQQHAQHLDLNPRDFPPITAPCACQHCLPAQPQPPPEVGPEENACQCHICLQQRGQTVSTALPTCPPIPPRPAQLHLYPHIHGTLPPAPQHLHPSLLPPQLYNLHGPRLPFKLDFEDPDGMDPLQHAYGDWDNSLHRNPLLPPVSHSLQSFSDASAPSSAASHALLGSLASAPNSAFKPVAAGFCTEIPAAFQFPAEPSSLQEGGGGSSPLPPHASTPELNLSVSSALLQSSSLPMTFSAGVPTPPVSLPPGHNAPPCSRPLTLGGNVHSPTPKEQRTYAQPCKKYTTSSSHNAPVPGAVKAAAAPPPPPPSSHSGSAGPGFTGGGKPVAKSPRQPAPVSQSHHTCTHPGHAQHAVHGGGGEGQAELVSALGGCPSSTTAPTTINNVSVGTSTLCTDPDCQSHHDDNCDSIDDSCSEKSSTTSTSNAQKEGKYCDCCYCEFFGHGNPPVAQTSKNFTEMRERLRRRLKQRNEAKQDRGELDGQSDDKHEGVKMENLDELLNFINGIDSTAAQQAQSSKAAKRARQKQRKAEEKAQAEQRAEEERRRAEAAQRLLLAEKASNSAAQRKKGKHKDAKQQKAVRPPPAPETFHKECVLKEAQAKASKSKPRLKESTPENQAEKSAGTGKAEAVVTNGKIHFEKYVEPCTPPGPSEAVPVSQMNGRLPRTSAEVFQPPAHLMRSLAEQTMQPAPTLGGLHSGGPLPTLGGQPNSPTAKKAKRRLGPGGQLSAQRKLVLSGPEVEVQRRLEAKQDVAQQMKEAEQFALHQTQLRQLAQRAQTQLTLHDTSPPYPPQHTPHMDQRLAQLRQLQAAQKQQQAAAPKQAVNGRPPALAPAPAPAKSPAPAQQNGKVATANGVAGQHISISNHTKTSANGPIPRGAGDPVHTSSWSGPGRNKPISAGCNGLTAPLQAQVRISPTPHSNSASQQIEQTKNLKAKSKKKKKANQDLGTEVDEVFLPRPEGEWENNDIDEADRDIEKFKRFVMEAPNPPRQRQKLEFSLNMKDIFSKKKSGMGCS